MSLPQKNGHTPAEDMKPLVFAVDDEPMLLELVASVLEPLGYRVRTFRDPATAVRAFSLAKPQPALIVTDYAMHRMNGMDLIREITTVYDNYGYDPEVLVANIRHPLHVTEAALGGGDIATMPFNVSTQLMKHPLTDAGLERFLRDWQKVKGRG